MEKLELNIEGMHCKWLWYKITKGFIHHCRSKCYRYKFGNRKGNLEVDFSQLKWNKIQRKTIEDGIFCVKGE